ncbi:hypothetical protein VOLCADRAFT_95512 [Volvox carteri f. nagariensis]|uniref:Uncharacterized protein n=1 Tax=Volvox carteri f. nagariensis TaxID=3068 RepID=D8U7N7_VOLCA|nr:uncharacterized protein VOLCADRAFT_95512 [Volvox carteri f. nagariensis]EFJ44334.1 hypothetical protein VOLCADRAFT_95512 [Volvox carteri f. nagariensis]|eukprot:XP_002954693.1 hypothetical protein VOLCADRAFT_95512 [Volvox carteri f. nagariensis]
MGGWVYQNCRMLSHEGQLLCFCDSRKLRWYLNKGLAVQVCEDPPTIQLLFEHQNTDQKLGEQLGGHRATGREGVREGEGGTDDFYTQSKSNRCVGCGCSSHYLRYRVLPACYRRHMPSALKSHRSHDVVLLCIDCHELAQKPLARQHSGHRRLRTELSESRMRGATLLPSVIALNMYPFGTC